MKATGIVRRIDELGRVVIPKEIRKTLRIKEGDPLEIYTDREELLFKKYSPIASFENYSEGFTKSLNAVSEKAAVICDTDTVVSATGNGCKDLIGKTISDELEKIIRQRKSVLINSGDSEEVVKIVKGDENIYFGQVIVPILSGGDCLGVVVLADKKKDEKITGEDLKLAQMSAELIANLIYG